MIEATRADLPAARPRYLMGVGTPDDLLEARAARHRHVRLRHADAGRPPRPCLHAGTAASTCAMRNMRTIRARSIRTSSCEAARIYSRAYLHHLVKAGEILAMMLLTTINLAYYEALMADIRTAIAAGRYADFCAETKERWARGEGPQSGA